MKIIVHDECFVLLSHREASCGSLSLLASVDTDIVKEHLLPSVVTLMSDSKGKLHVEVLASCIVSQ